WGWLMLLSIAGAVVLTRHILKRPAARYRWDHAMLKVPLVGRLIRGLNTARFARTLNILAGSGVPLLDALNMSASVISNTPMRDAVSDAAKKVREGAGVGHSLERSGYFPPMTLSLIKSGESSGTLDKMLERAAETQERELEARIAMVMGVFEPLLILAMGGVVLIIVLAILLPIFELNQLVN
ncbi:MAG: type II secretion system F family protein, partial [Pseudomonas sp.]